MALASQVARTVLVALTVWWVGPWPPKALVIFKTAPGPISSSSPASPSASLTAHPRPRFLWREGTPARRQRMWVDPDALWALQRKQVGKVKTAGLHQASRQARPWCGDRHRTWHRPQVAKAKQSCGAKPGVPGAPGAVPISRGRFWAFQQKSLRQVTVTEPRQFVESCSAPGPSPEIAGA